MIPRHDLRHCRSLLFLPASNPRAIAKARELAADMIFLDLEDGVKPEDRPEARKAAGEAVREGFGGRPAAIRVNRIGTADYGADIIALRHGKADYVILPKVEKPGDVHDARRLLERPVLAMIETAAGVLHAAAIAREAAGLIAGTNDLSADLGLPPGVGREGLAVALQTIVLAARAARIAAFDGVFNALDDPEGFEKECEEGRRYGFDGKTLIHPGQVEIANRVFSPGEHEVEEARRLVAAATGGAERFEGRMIEAMHVEQARLVLARAREA
jgi:citrate lyase subunit beta/citryl-CoA lyase